MTAESVEDMLGQMGILNYEKIPIAESWSETLVRFIGRIAPILMMIGLAALYMEMKAPGFGLPGIVGIVCLAVVFLSQYLVGLADYTELLILAFGLVLMAIEVFVLPGFGIAGFAGIVLLALGLILSLQGFVIPDPEVPWEMEILAANVIDVVGAFILSFFVGLFFLRYVLPRFSAVRQGPFLEADLKSAHADSTETARVRVGDQGIALTLLRPSGKMKIADEILDVTTDNEFIEKGTPVAVVAIRGNRVIVAPASSDNP
jgi:membrane-bound serine protease (ClpP class)